MIGYIATVYTCGTGFQSVPHCLFGVPWHRRQDHNEFLVEIVINTMREQLAQLLSERNGQLLADGFAEIIEDRISFDGTADDYFASVLRLPSPLLELYAALIFNSRVRSDGLADTLPLYDKPEFMDALRQGLNILDLASLYAIIDRARTALRDPASTALRSNAPNVKLDQETGNIHHAYFANNEQLMPRIGEYLLRQRDQVLAAATDLDAIG